MPKIGDSAPTINVEVVVPGVNGFSATIPVRNTISRRDASFVAIRRVKTEFNLPPGTAIYARILP